MSDLGFPFRPVDPGELLKDELQSRNLSQKSVAKQLGLPYTAFNEVLNGKRPVTTDFAMIMEAGLVRRCFENSRGERDFAMIMEAGLGTSSSLLLRMQTDYNLQVAKQDKSFASRLANIRKIASVL